jgi:beta-glucanase (GH16 family)
VPYGQGMWPAFWMLGDNINVVNWPACGEIDIMENIGNTPATDYGHLHGPGYVGANYGASYSLPKGNLSDAYHLYAIEWEPNVVRFYLDTTKYLTLTSADIGGNPWVFDHPFFMILNLAVGGSWPGDPDQTTVFPQTMWVDYVRVYTR